MNQSPTSNTEAKPNSKEKAALPHSKRIWIPTKPIEYKHSPKFDEPSFAVGYLQEPASLDRKIESLPSDHHDLLSADEERYLFYLMNYRTHQAEAMRQVLDPHNPHPEIVREIDRLMQVRLEVRNRIICFNRRLVGSIAKSYAVNQDERDTYFSEGVEALLRATELFNVDRGFKFSTYATWAIRNRINRWIRKERPHRHTKQLGFRNDDGSIEIVLKDANANPIELNIKHALGRAQILCILRHLTIRDRRILALRFGLLDDKARSLEEVGDEYSITKERVRQVVNKSLENARRRLVGNKSSMQVTELTEDEYRKELQKLLEE